MATILDDPDRPVSSARPVQPPFYHGATLCLATSARAGDPDRQLQNLPDQIRLKF